jgi:hypothetical protein
VTERERSVLIKNINRLHLTKLGLKRIEGNLGLEPEEALDMLKIMIKYPFAEVERVDKNWHVRSRDVLIVVNASTYTIITARIVEQGFF